jgi:hypothetical protein
MPTNGIALRQNVDEMAVLKLLTVGHDIGRTAELARTSKSEILQIANRYGYPDASKLTRAMEMLYRQRLACDADVVAESEIGTGAGGTGLTALLHQARDSRKARTRALGARIGELLADLRDRLDAEAAEQRRRDECERERLVVAEELRAAEEALRIAKEKARRYKVKPTDGGAGTAALAHSQAARDARRKAGLMTDNRSDYNTREVREWARAHGVDCPSRGRYLPAAVVRAWREATQ